MHARNADPPDSVLRRRRCGDALRRRRGFLQTVNPAQAFSAWTLRFIQRMRRRPRKTTMRHKQLDLQPPQVSRGGKAALTHLRSDSLLRVQADFGDQTVQGAEISLGGGCDDVDISAGPVNNMLVFLQTHQHLALGIRTAGNGVD